MRKTGVLGGSFNPIHLAHLAMAKHACKELGLDRVLFIPAGLPPHKRNIALAPPKDRLEMVKRAIAGRPEFEVSDIELRRSGPSYTIETIEALRREYGPEAEFFLLIGMDSLNELGMWKDVRRLASLCKVVPLDRPGAREADAATLKRALGGKEARAILARRIHMPLMDISSSDIRARVAAGRSIRRLVPAAVADYIHKRGLYRGATSPAPLPPPRCCAGASRQSSARRRRARE